METIKVPIVYKTYSGDKDFLWDSLRSVKKFVKNYGRIFLVTDDDLGEIPTDITDLDIAVIQNPQFITDAAKGENITAGYLNQIIIKLELFRYLPVEIERVLYLDSDMIINQVWDIAKEPNRWYFREWEKAGSGRIWKKAVDAVFQNSKNKQGMGYPGWFLTRHLMNCLLSYLAKRTQSANIDESFWKKMVRLCNSKFSEFEIMGNYLLLIDPLDYEICELKEQPYPIIQYWSWGQYGQPNKETGIIPRDDIQLILNATIVAEPPEPLPVPLKNEKKKEKKPKVQTVGFEIETSFDQKGFEDTIEKGIESGEIKTLEDAEKIAESFIETKVVATDETETVFLT